MSLLNQIRRALVIAPHPDDEILGCGGTMARLSANGCEVHVAVVTRGVEPRFAAEQVAQVHAEARAAHDLLRVSSTRYLDFPAAELDRVPHVALNAALESLVLELRPDTVFLPFIGDIHLDHQLIFTSTLVAVRPKQDSFPVRLYAYETLSETNWLAPYITPNFVPNVFVDISDFLEAKLEAFKCFRSQVQPFPSERSVEALRALAVRRGTTVCRRAAEAFVLIREVG